MCENIAKIRRRLKNISKRKIIFLDETHLKLNEAVSSTLLAPGETPYVIVSDNTSYSKRYDMIACCSGIQLFISSCLLALHSIVTKHTSLLSLSIASACFLQ